MIRRLLVLWRRARHTGRDLDLAGWLAFIAGAAMLVATGVVGPTIDARAPLPIAAELHAGRE